MWKIFSDKSGYSLISIITLMSLLGVLTTIAIVSFNSNIPTVRIKAGSKKLISDISYAQDTAMAQGCIINVVINISDNQYYIKKGDGTYLKNLMGGGNFTVDFDHPDYSGVSIDSTGLIQGVLSFNAIGIPSTGGARIEHKTLVASLNNQVSIYVVPYTGKLLIE